LEWRDAVEETGVLLSGRTARMLRLEDFVDNWVGRRNYQMMFHEDEKERLDKALQQELPWSRRYISLYECLTRNGE